MDISPVITNTFNKYQLPFLFLLVLLSTGYLYGPTLGSLLDLWLQFDESMGHGILVLLVSAYLVYGRINWTSPGQVKPGFIAVIPLVILSIIWAMALSVDINIIQQLLIPLIFLASIYLLAGRKVTLKICVPVLLFYFAVPVWDYLNGFLLDLTTGVVQWWIGYSGITAYIQGNSIFLPSGEIVIAGGCSGIRYLIIGLFLAVLSGYLYFQNNLVRLGLISMVIVLSLIANWIRVYAIIIVAYYTEMQSPLVNNHETLGWFVFILFMLPLFYINYKYQVPPGKLREKAPENIPARHSIIPAIVLFVPAIASGPVVAHIYDSYEHSGTIPLAEISETSIGYGKLAEISTESAWAPNISKPEVSSYTSEAVGSFTVNKLVYGYKRTTANREILPYTSEIHNRDTWTVSRGESLLLEPGNDSKRLKKLELINKYSGQRILLYYFYNIGGFETDTYHIAKLLQIPATLSGNAWALITFIWSECNLDCEQQSDIIESHIPDMIFK